MDRIEQVEARREARLEELRSLRSLKRGTINEQYLKGYRKGQKEAVLHGPYYVFSRREGPRTVSRRLRPGAELKQAREDVARHKRFVQLCRELEQLTEKLGELERQSGAGRPKKKRSP